MRGPVSRRHHTTRRAAALGLLIEFAKVVAVAALFVCILFYLIPALFGQW
jgi:hypothetical protein